MTLTILAFVATIAVSLGFGFLALRNAGRRRTWLEELEAGRVPVPDASRRRSNR